MAKKEKLIGKDGTVYAVGAREVRRGKRRERLQELFDSGEAERMTQGEVAKRVGVSDKTVSQLMKEMGLSRAFTRGRPRDTGLRERLQELFDSGEAEGLTRKEIGKRIRGTPSRVSVLMREMGLSGVLDTRGRPRDTGLRERLQELFDSGEAEGLTRKEIAERVGASDKTAYRLMKELGLSYKKPRPSLPQTRIQELFDSGEAESLTQREIAERIRVSRSRVSQLMIEMGVKPSYQRHKTRLQELFDSGEAEGLTQREIGERVGVGKTSVSRLMREMGLSYQKPRRPSPTQKRLQERKEHDD